MPPSVNATSPRHLLLATDFGSRADRAEERAAERARALGARLHVLTVDEGSRQEKASRVGDARDADTVVAQMRTRYGAELDVEATAAAGEAWRVICAEASARGCGLIVLGSAEPEGLQERLLGSTAERVIHHAEVPVLTVRGRCKGPYRRVIAAVDFSSCSRQALTAAAAVLPEASFLVTHAYRVPFPGFVGERANEPELRRDAEAAMGDFMAGLAETPGLAERSEARLLYGTPEEAFGKLALEPETDLLVVGSHGSGGTFDKLLGGTAERLIARMPCDVLVTRTPAARSATPARGR